MIVRPSCHQQVYCRSSDRDRCIISAQTHLNGLYPPHGQQVIRAQLLEPSLPVCFWIWQWFSTKMPALQCWKPDEWSWFFFIQTHPVWWIRNWHEQSHWSWLPFWVFGQPSPEPLSQYYLLYSHHPIPHVKHFFIIDPVLGYWKQVGQYVVSISSVTWLVFSH